MLQCFAVCVVVLRCVAVFGGVLWRVAGCCIALWCGMVLCSWLQYGAKSFN